MGMVAQTIETMEGEGERRKKEKVRRYGLRKGGSVVASESIQELMKFPETFES
jgi:hypothetical protein